MADDSDSEEILTIENSDVVTKYKIAADISNRMYYKCYRVFSRRSYLNFPVLINAYLHEDNSIVFIDKLSSIIIPYRIA